jgi:hypothetical protein
MTADPSPARVAAERGRSERRNADRWHPSSTQPAEPASSVPAPTPDGQGDAESRDVRISDEAVEAARRALSNLWRTHDEATVEDEVVVALAAAVPHLERQIRESIAGEIEGYAGDLDMSDDRCNEREWQLLANAARIARGQSS